jgi:hypothetical protein
MFKRVNDEASGQVGKLASWQKRAVGLSARARQHLFGGKKCGSKNSPPLDAQTL